MNEIISEIQYTDFKVIENIHKTVIQFPESSNKDLVDVCVEFINGLAKLYKNFDTVSVAVSTPVYNKLRNDILNTEDIRFKVYDCIDCILILTIQGHRLYITDIHVMKSPIIK